MSSGNKRVVRDSCISLYNYVQKWKKFTSELHFTVSTICQVKYRELSELESEEKSYEELIKLSTQLQTKFEDLVSVLKKMEKISSQLKAVCELSQLQNSSYASDISFDTENILFQTWSLNRFYETSEEVVKMHREELKIKSIMSKEICIITEKSALQFFELCWKYETNIDRDRLNMLLDGFIFELELL